MKFSRRRFDAEPWLAALVAAAVLAAFSPSLLNGFVVWDDDMYLTGNPIFHGGALAAAKWGLTTTYLGMFSPLVWLSYAADYALAGLQPWLFHLTNVALHAAASVLVFFALRELLAKAAGPRDRSFVPYGAAAGALFFAIHPLRVESVTWIAERKDVLTAVLWVGSLLAYLRGRVKTALLLFAASLLAKLTGLMLPFALVVIDVYPLRRLPADPRRWTEARFREVWYEKAAFLAVALLGLAVGLLALRAYGALHGMAELGPAWRLDQSLYALWFYPAKTLWPGRLSPFYVPLPWFGRFWPHGALLAAASAAAGGAAWSLRRRAPAVPAALCAYVVLIMPALGFFENGQLSAACGRYSYLPGLPFAALFGAAVVAAARRRRLLSIGVAAAACAALGAGAYAQTFVWRDTASLWSRALESQPDCGLALMNLGVARTESGRFDEAADLFERARRAGVADPRLLADLGGALSRLGRREEAIAAFRRALVADGTLGDVRRALSALLAQGADESAAAGRPAAALRGYRAALAVDASNGAARNNRGLLLDALGRRGQARRDYELALREPSAAALAHYNWGNSLLASGDDAGAERHFTLALSLDPRLARAEVNRANIYARRGRLAEAVAGYRRALKKDPGLSEARANLAAVERLRRR